MKLNKNVKLVLIIILIIALVALMGFVLANNNNSKILVTRDRTSVILKQQEDPTKVDVYLGMADTASIASFQIGLDVDVATNYDASFDWASNLNNGEEKFKDFRINEGRDEQTSEGTERINIYYVGTKELNQLTDKMDIDNIKIGTISLNYVKDAEGKPTSTAGSTLLVKPIGTDKNEATKTDEDFTKTVSMSHEVSSVVVKDDDILRTTIPENSSQNPNPQNPTPQNPNPQNPDSQIPATGITLDKTSLLLNMEANKTGTLTATVTPEDTTDTNITWSSSNESVATVKGNGNTAVVTALATGTTNITVKVGEKTATCKVVVTSETIKEVAIDHEDFQLVVGASEQLNAIFNPENTTDNIAVCEWKSDDESIVSVDNNGKVTANKVGEATVTLTVNGKTASVKITVVPASDSGKENEGSNPQGSDGQNEGSNPQGSDGQNEDSNPQGSDEQNNGSNPQDSDEQNNGSTPQNSNNKGRESESAKGIASILPYTGDVAITVFIVLMIISAIGIIFIIRKRQKNK